MSSVTRKTTKYHPKKARNDARKPDGQVRGVRLISANIYEWMKHEIEEVFLLLKTNILYSTGSRRNIARGTKGRSKIVILNPKWADVTCARSPGRIIDEVFTISSRGIPTRGNTVQRMEAHSTALDMVYWLIGILGKSTHTTFWKVTIRVIC